MFDTDEEVDALIAEVAAKVLAVLPLVTSEDLKVFTRAIVEKVLDGLELPDLQPGTVQAATADGVTVALDIDEASGVTIVADPLGGQLMRQGQRVMVLFQPPRGVFVMGLIQSTFGPVILVLDHVPTDADWPYAPPDGVEAVDSTTLRKYVRVNGAYHYSTLT